MTDNKPPHPNSPDDPPELPEGLYQRAREALSEGRFEQAIEAFFQQEIDLDALIENLRIYQAELKIQNQELRASRADLERSIGRFAALFSATPVALLIVDDKGLIRETNLAAEQLFRLTGNRLRQSFFIRLIADAERGAAIEALSDALTVGQANLIEIGLRTPHGEPFIGDLHIAPLPGEREASQPHELICAVFDRSDAVRQRQVLREGAEALRQSRAELAERVNEQSCLYEILKLKLQHDQPVAEILRRIANRLVRALPEPDQAQVVIQLPSQTIRSLGPSRVTSTHEIAFDLPDGDRGSLRVAYANDGTPAEPIAPKQTELLRAVAGHLEGFLRERATREAYRVLAEYSPEWEYWLGPDGCYVYVSPACERITGYPPAAFEDDSGLLARLIHPDDRTRYLVHRDAQLSHPMDNLHPDEERLEFRLRTRRGDWIWIDHLCNPVMGSDGQWLGRRGANRDITARKQAEAEALRMTALYRTLSAANQAIVQYASEAELLPAICRIVVQEGGLTACAICRRDPATGTMTLTAYDGAHPPALDAQGQTAAAPPIEQDKAMVHGLSLPLVVADKTVAGLTVHYREADFITPDILALLAEMADDVAYALAHFAEEAARDRAERELRAREQELAAIFETAGIAIGIVENRHILRANDRLFEMTGLTPDEVIGHSARRLYPDEAEFQRIGSELYGQLTDSSSASIEARLQHKDGHPITVLISLVPLDRANPTGPIVFSMLDITDRQRAEQALKDSEERLRLTLQATSDGIWDWDIASGAVTVNDRFSEMLGYAPGDVQMTYAAFVAMLHPEDRPGVLAQLDQHLKDAAPYQVECRMRTKAQDWIWIEARGKVVAQDAEGRPTRMVGTHADITERKATEERLRLAAKVFESTADAVLITDPEQRVQAVNQAFSAITGHAAEAILGQTLKALQVGRRDENLFRPLWAILTKTDRWQGQRWCQRKDGQPFCARISVTTVTAADGAPLNHIIVFGDITRLHQTQQELDHLTHHDALTGLPNRNLFRLRLEHGLQRAARDATRLAVLLLDLDRFRVINESLGATHGDRFLKEIGTSLLGALRSADTLARLGGDEFGVILEDLNAPHEVAEVVARLRERCATPRTIEDETLAITGSLGIAVFPSDGEDGETLLRHADIALKRAKTSGPNGHRFYEAAMDEEAVARLQIESCLREAIIANELRLHYQPQVRLDDGQLVGAEALLRWESTRLGRISPGRFIPIAEEMGMIGEIGLWVLTQGCEQLAAWDRQGHHLPRLAINLSIQQLEQPDLIGQIEQVLARTGIDPARLDLEITESLIIRQAEQSIATLNSLRELGLRLVIDDFGTGYSSLAYLRRLPLQQLKIDKSFVDDLTTDANSQAVANAIIALGKSLGFEILAEGIEYPEQAAWLLKAGCELAQGYHYARPLPPDDLATQWLASKT